MHKSIALTLAICLAAMLPASHATAAGPELLFEEHYSADGYQIDHYVTRAADGVLSEATLTDPQTGEAVDVWSDGITVWWDGVADGEPVHGAVLATDFDQGPQDLR